MDGESDQGPAALATVAAAKMLNAAAFRAALLVRIFLSNFFMFFKILLFKN